MSLQIKDFLSEEVISIQDCKDMRWKDAIRIAAEPLLLKKIVSKGYIEKMIENVIKFGPYINLAENFAMPHARPEDGANDIGVSLLILDKPVYLLEQEEHPVKVILCLSCKDATTHLEILADLADFLSVEDNLARLEKCDSKREVLQIFREEAS